MQFFVDRGVDRGAGEGLEVWMCDNFEGWRVCGGYVCEVLGMGG